MGKEMPSILHEVLHLYNCWVSALGLVHVLLSKGNVSWSRNISKQPGKERTGMWNLGNLK